MSIRVWVCQCDLKRWELWLRATGWRRVDVHETDYSAFDCFDSQDSLNEVHYGIDVTLAWNIAMIASFL